MKMPDISLCLNKDCPIKEQCYRFTAIPSNYHQSYTLFEYDNGCDNFLEIKPKENDSNTRIDS